MLVRAYRNLQRNLWSVAEKKTGLVLFHARSIVLEHCSFKVQPAGRKRVLLEKRKNVHAWVEGNITPLRRANPDSLCRVIYNPYSADHFFMERTMKPVNNAEMALLNSDGRLYATS